MPNVNFYPGGGRSLLGGQVDEIPYITANRGQINTPESERYRFAAKMVEALTAKAEKDKKKKIRSNMLAAMMGPSYEYGPSQASESFVGSPYVETQRDALRDAQAQAQPEGVSALGLSPDGMALTPSLQLVDMEPPPPGVGALFGADPWQSENNAAMQAALIGDVATPDQELAAYTGSAEDRAAQERDYRATVNTPGAEEARMAQLVASNPEIENTDEYVQWVQSHLARKQALVDEQRKHEQAIELTAADHEFQKELKELEFGSKKGDSQFDREDTLRKEFEKGTKDFIKVRDAFGRIQASASDPSAAGDLALIFNFMKVLDPGSTVREGEFATAASAAGIGQRLRAQYNKVIEGTRLSDTQRSDFVNRAQKLYASQLKQYQSHEDYYRGLAETYNLDPENVVYGMGESITFENFGTGDGNGAGAATENGIDLTIVPGGVDPAIWGEMTNEAKREFYRLADVTDGS